MTGKRSSVSSQCGRWFFVLVVGGVWGVGNQAAASVVDFEDLALPAQSFYNGSDGVGGFITRGVLFNNTFSDFGGGFTGWYGWSYSNMTDVATPGFENQYSAIPGHGAGGSSNFGVAFATAPGDATIDVPDGSAPQSMLITNTTFAFLAMRNGTPFSKTFGGLTGDDPDFFLLSITGLNAGGEPIGLVDFYLADYRFADNSLDYVIDSWTEVDLSSLHGASRLSFGMTSSDVGAFGMNTPAYFAVDNLRVVPEPATWTLLAFGGIVALRRGAARKVRVVK